MYTTTELSFSGTPEVRENKNQVSNYCGQFFIVATAMFGDGETKQLYLHADGRWGRFAACDENLRNFCGYYKTREAAEETLRRFGP